MAAGPPLITKRPFRCGCGGARFFLYGDKNDIECVKCRSRFHVYPLASDIEHALRLRRGQSDQALTAEISEKHREKTKST